MNFIDNQKELLCTESLLMSKLIPIAKRSVQLYDTKNNALTIAGQIQAAGPPPGAPVTLLSVNTYDVIAQV